MIHLLVPVLVLLEGHLLLPAGAHATFLFVKLEPVRVDLVAQLWLVSLRWPRHGFNCCSHRHTLR